PDLVENAVSAPPATKARGTSFDVTDTAQNLAAVAAGPSVTRYYLSLLPGKSAGDTPPVGGPLVPAPAAGSRHGGTRRGALPTPPSRRTKSHSLRACADDRSAVGETTKANTGRPSTTTVMLTPCPDGRLGPLPLTSKKRGSRRLSVLRHRGRAPAADTATSAV